MWRVLSLSILLSNIWLGTAEHLSRREFTPRERREYLMALMDDPDTSTFDRISAINEVKGVNNYEGDLKLTKKDLRNVDTREDGDADGTLEETNTKRNVQRDRSSLWRTRRVPYVIDQALVKVGFHDNIMKAIDEVKRVSCVQWVKRTYQKHYVKFVYKSGCWSYVGNIRDEKGYQELSIGDGCETIDTILHEMFHAMGFWHEQSRPDRNKYIEILWENIQPGQKENFNKYKHSDVDYLSTRYDYDSIMHYGKMAFSKNGQPTIKVIGDKERNFGAAQKLSEIDIMRLNAFYECSNKERGWSSWSSFGPCDVNCERTRQRYCFEDHIKSCPGADEYGIQTEIKSCSASECKGVINGHWGRWSAYTKCSGSCGKGTRTRTRLCDDPNPQKGGNSCVGSGKEVLPCELKPCVGVVSPNRANVLEECTFNKGECGWKNDEYNYKKCFWRRQNGALVLDAGQCEEFDYSRFNSEKIPAAPSGACLSFRYRISSKQTGNLVVWHYKAGDIEVELFSTEGGTGKSLKQAKVNFKSQEKFNIIFEAAVNKPSGTMEIDDVVVTKGKC